MNMDFPDRRYSFLSFLVAYHRLFYVIFSVAFVLSVFAADLRLSACYELAFSAVLALLFNGWLTLCYEMSLHNPATYTPFRRFTVVMLGWSAFFLFAIGLLLGIKQLYSR